MYHIYEKRTVIQIMVYYKWAQKDLRKALPVFLSQSFLIVGISYLLPLYQSSLLILP